MEPDDLRDPRVRLDVALEVDVHALPEGAGVEGAAQLQRHDGHVYGQRARVKEYVYTETLKYSYNWKKNVV